MCAIEGEGGGSDTGPGPDGGSVAGVSWGDYFFFPVRFLPFFLRLFFRILMLHVLFQLTFAIRPPRVRRASYTGTPLPVTTPHCLTGILPEQGVVASSENLPEGGRATTLKGGGSPER